MSSEFVEFRLTDGAVGAKIPKPWVDKVTRAVAVAVERAAAADGRAPVERAAAAVALVARAALLKIDVDMCVAEFCLVLPYMLSGRVVARAPVADWPRFARACAALGARELPMRIIDDAELVFLCALTLPHFLRRETEFRVRQLYQLAERAGCDDPPAERAGCDDPPAARAGCDDPPAEDYRTAQRRRVGELALHSSALAGALDVDGCVEALAALACGSLVCELPPKILQMSEPEIAREYPYTTVSDCAMPPNLYKSTACAVEALRGALPDFPWRAAAGAQQFILAGGAPLRHLRVGPHGFAGSDIDFFLVGVDEAGARAAIADFHAWVAEHTGGQFMGWRTEHAISFVTETLVYQIVLRLNPSIERVLLNFDIDACCVAFDGERLWTTPRGLAALRSGINLGDPERQSTTFDRRAVKYSRRGYRLALPGLSAAAHARLLRDFDRTIPHLRSLSKDLCADPARSMIERVMRGGRRPSTGDPATEGIPGDYAPHFALPGGRTLADYIRAGMQAMAAPGANTLAYVIVATTALAPLLDTPQGAALAELRAAIGRGDPHFVYRQPLAPANSITFLRRLGHGQLSGSINPVAINGWFPDECGD